MEPFQLISSLAGLAMFIGAFLIIHKKQRGVGYYFLAVFSPLIGFIVSLCIDDLSERDDEEDNAKD